MFIWSQYNRGVYKVKSGYQLLVEGTQHNTHTSTNSQQIWKNLWRLKIPFRLIILLWEILNNALPIMLCLERRNIVTDKVCVLCHLEEQDLDHLFLPCSFAKALWMELAIILRSDLLQPNSFIHWLKQWLQDIKNCRVLRPLFEINMLNIFHVSTKHQLADIFTKPIGHVQFFKLLSKMGILNIYTPS